MTKRTRFEVLRRDGHKCRYCGTSASGTELSPWLEIPGQLQITAVA